MGAHTIEVRREGDGFAVVVVPPHLAHPPAHYHNKRSAFGAAGGLRLVTGWRRVDLTGD